ncbi:MAG TPA: sulfotransferase [Solirubrobacterales bacterium]|nr:sulfotransferase [Solirubrobacterales bacterium]
MAGAVIHDVELPAHGSERFLGRRIDRPAANESSTDLLEISGWVVVRDGEPVSVEVIDRDFRLRTAPVDQKREDVANTFSDPPSAQASGFQTAVGTVGLPLEFELLLRVNLADGRKLPLALIRGRRQPMATAYEPQLPPIMVTALGRSGTTMLMHSLAASPDIVVGGAYPYEFRFARYWLHAAKVLSDPPDPNNSPSLDAFQHDLGSIPNNPYFNSRSEPTALAWLAESQPPLVAELAQRSLDGMYGELAAERGNGRYFAEKFAPSYAQSIAWEIYGDRTRELFLVRDFRDVLCSIIAFNRKRGFEGFGRSESADDLDFVRRLGGAARSLLREYEERRDRAHFVRYEDLVTDPEAAFSAIADYLGLDATAAEAMVAATTETSAKLDRHKTSADPAASIGRWRQDLDPEIAAACEEAFAAPLEAFGYGEETHRI